MTYRGIDRPSPLKAEILNHTMQITSLDKVLLVHPDPNWGHIYINMAFFELPRSLTSSATNIESVGVSGSARSCVRNRRKVPTERPRASTFSGPTPGRPTIRSNRGETLF